MQSPLRRVALVVAAAATALAGSVVAVDAQADPVNLALPSNPGNTPVAAASFTNSSNVVDYLFDGVVGGRNWNSWSEGSTSSVTVSWPRYVQADSARIHLWTDCPTDDDCWGGVLLPTDLQVQYYDKASDSYLPVAYADGVAPVIPEGVSGTRDYQLDIDFDTVKTAALRIAFSNGATGAGATELLFFGENTTEETTDPDPVDPGDPGDFVDVEQVEARTTPGVLPELPETIWATYEATAARAAAGEAPLVNDLPVTWDTSSVSAADYDAAGDAFVVDGVIDGTDVEVEADVTVHAAPLSQEVTDVDPVSTLTTPGIAPVFPTTLTATYADGSRASGVPATWSTPTGFAEAESIGFVDAVSGGKTYPELGIFLVVAPSPADAPPIVWAEFSDGTLAASGWHTSKPTFRVRADRGVTDSAIVSLEYCLSDCAGADDWTEYRYPVDLEQQGALTLQVRATDEEGRVGTSETDLKIDTHAPVTTQTNEVSGLDATITLSASDLVDGVEGSGVSRTLWSSGPNSSPNSSENVMWGTYNPDELIRIQLSSTRVTYVHFRSEDAAGNQEAVKTISFQPVAEPSPSPSVEPSATPTAEPSATPSVEPSATPSVKPSATPSVKPTTQPPAPVDIYTTPGFHNVNGRHWYTSCEAFSATKRCRTDIWSTAVQKIDGRLVAKTGWNFNSLTYLPMSRATWAGNPLATTGTFTSGGRQWRTECDTATTGRGGCRNYLWTTTYAASQGSDGAWKYTQRNQWVLNSMIRFS